MVITETPHLSLNSESGADMAPPWISMDTHGYPWISMDIPGNPWISMDVHSRLSTGFVEKST